MAQALKISTAEKAKTRTNAISKDDLQNAARKYLKPEQRLQFVLMPETASPNKGQTPKQNHVVGRIYDKENETTDRHG